MTISKFIQVHPQRGPRDGEFRDQGITGRHLSFNAVVFLQEQKLISIKYALTFCSLCCPDVTIRPKKKKNEKKKKKKSHRCRRRRKCVSGGEVEERLMKC